VDWDLVERARSLTGVKGYLTSIDTATMDGAAVIAAYTDLYQVERSFRMTKSDLAARPVFHRLKDSIEAHLTIVFAALAVSREAQTRTGLSIKKIITTLPERARRRTYTAKYKSDILAQYEACDRVAKGALLRREGLYTSLISGWRDQRDAGALQALGRPAGAPPAGRAEGGGPAA